jgi:ATP-binding cassette, subfamily B (MDR/TAP), member 1
LIDRRPAIDSWSTYGEPISLKSVRGRIEFRNVHFSYPSRPEDRILKALNIDVKPGQFIALVGPSGCGKSTTISLLERFYDASGGGIYVDGRDITKLDIKQWRSCMALVSQESSLYQGSIRDNILLGVERDDVTDEEVEKVCKDANIYDFVMSLPHGLSTDVGAKGTMLSGGQRQRICIARALLRNPRILLLDEATSALDSESEHMVQAALDKAASGRTTIAVAHRLSTIQNADTIYVLNHGRVAEKGTHAELMRHRGRYFELVRMQSLSQSQ